MQTSSVRGTSTGKQVSTLTKAPAPVWNALDPLDADGCIAIDTMPRQLRASLPITSQQTGS